jgi:ribonuclease D
LAALKTWRVEKAEALSLDPGVLCPNSALEAIAFFDPKNKTDAAKIEELKGWFVSEFATEVVGIITNANAS